MDFKTAVFNAARDGNLTRLKVYLHSWRSADELNMLVGAKVGGATPLVIACRNGHYDVAEYLIERCKADIEQPGSVTFDGETIEGAPPLWCAAAAGHLPLVRLLVRAGASVNSTTRTHSTPLRAACFDGHYDIVKFLVESGADIEIANRHGHTCLMIACYKGHIRIAKYLLALNADVNRKSVKGNTALHDCAESGSLHILKMLLQHGATMDVDSYDIIYIFHTSNKRAWKLPRPIINSCDIKYSCDWYILSFRLNRSYNGTERRHVNVNGNAFDITRMPHLIVYYINS